MYPDIRLCARQITCTGADVVLQCCGEKKSELLFHENVKLSITFGLHITIKCVNGLFGYVNNILKKQKTYLVEICSYYKYQYKTICL